MRGGCTRARLARKVDFTFDSILVANRYSVLRERSNLADLHHLRHSSVRRKTVAAEGKFWKDARPRRTDGKCRWPCCGGDPGREGMLSSTLVLGARVEASPLSSRRFRLGDLRQESAELGASVRLRRPPGTVAPGISRDLEARASAARPRLDSGLGREGLPLRCASTPAPSVE